MDPTSDDALLDLIPSRLPALLAAIDARIAAQLDAILHHPCFQQLERAWRGLWFLVSRTDFAENIRIAILDCSLDDLRADLANPAGVAASGLHAIVYTAELGRVGGEPFGAILADHAIGPEDLTLLARCAAVARAALAPFIAAASPRLFGVPDCARLSRLKDLASAFAGPEHEAWRAFRETEDARYVGLVLPRFLLRLPFRAAEGLAYEEGGRGDPETGCWGNATYAFAGRLADSFARYRWCPNIVGRLGGGAVDVTAEIALTEGRERELSEEGFVVLSALEAPGQACFHSASSPQRPRRFGDTEEGRAAEMNFRLGTQLPFMFIVTRVMHYLNMMYRSHFEAWGSRVDAEKELNDWVGQYVADRSVVTAATRGRRPLRKARLIIEGTAHAEAWHRLTLQVRPHFKHLGAFFTLTLDSRLEAGEVIDLAASDPVLRRFARDLERQAPLDLGEARPDLSRVTAADVEVAQTAWADRVIGEYRGVVIYTELLALLAQAEAPYAALAAVQRIIGDELRHTRLCATVVEWLGGWASLEVDLGGQRMPRWDGPPAGRALEIVARELIVVEEATVRTLRFHLRAVEDPAIRAVFQALLADEIRHAAAGLALRELLERRYPEEDLREARRGLEARLEADRRHLDDEERARAGDGPGRALGAVLRVEDLEGVAGD